MNIYIYIKFMYNLFVFMISLIQRSFKRSVEFFVAIQPCLLSCIKFHLFWYFFIGTYLLIFIIDFTEELIFSSFSNKNVILLMYELIFMYSFSH